MADLLDAPESANFENTTCYGAGSIWGAIFGTLVAVLLLELVLFFIYKNYLKNRKDQHLVTTDPENAREDFAFDNEGFHGDVHKENKTKSLLETKWLPIGTLTKQKLDKKTQDDSAASEPQTRVVPLRGKDFTGLGFDIFGGLRDGIFVKNVRNTGPAFQSGVIQPGARIRSIRIDFQHIVFEDALSILSSASPYDVLLEIEVSPSGTLTKKNKHSGRVAHPLYRSNSTADLMTINELNKKRYDSANASDYPTLKLEKTGSDGKAKEIIPPKPASRSSTIDRNDEKQYQIKPVVTIENEKHQTKSFKTTIDEMNEKMIEINKPERTKKQMSPTVEENKQQKDVENDGKKGLKFGIRVLPPNVNDKMFGLHQKPSTENDNNVNIERGDTTDVGPVPVVKRRSKEPKEVAPPQEETPQDFVRDVVLNSSGIKRDSAGIPQEIPNHMLQAALAAKSNRKSLENLTKDVDNVTNIKKDIVETKEEIQEIKKEISQTKNDIVKSLENLNHDEKLVYDSVDISQSEFLLHPKSEDEGTDKGTLKSAKKSKGKAPLPPPVVEIRNFHDTDFDVSTDTNITNLSLDVTDGGNSQQNLVLDFDLIENIPERTAEKVAGDAANRSDDSITLKDKPSNSSTPKSSKKSFKNEETNSDTESFIQQNNKASDEYSDSDVELPNTSPSGTTIELNSSHITIHHISPTEDIDDNDTRRTASLGDLSKLNDHKINQKSKSNTGTLERAQSLDIPDPNEQTLTPKKRKATNGGQDYYNSLNYNEDELYMNSKEPKLMTNINLNLLNNDDLNTFQRNRLKKSTEWGNLEDAIFKKSENSSENSSSENIDSSSINDELINQKQINLSPENISFKITTTNLNFGDVNPKLPVEVYETNIPDDIKVSRHSFGSLERSKTDPIKTVVSRNPSSELGSYSLESESQPISLTLIQNDPTYDFQISTSVVNNSSTRSPTFTSDFKGVNSININSNFNNLPDVDDNVVTIVNDKQQPSSIITIESDTSKINTISLMAETEPDFKEILTISHENEFNNDLQDLDEPLPKLPTSKIPTNQFTISDIEIPVSPTEELKSYITEIQVLTPKSEEKNKINTEIKKNIENNIEIEEKPKIFEYARNSEIKFSTSTYEQPKSEKRLSQIELLRSNFEKNNDNLKSNIPKPIISSKPNLSPSKIPVFNSKTNDTQKSPIKNSVSVTAIKSSSRNPSGKLP